MATAAQRKKALALRRIGMSTTQIGAEVGVHPSTVRRWSMHIPKPVHRRRVSFDIQEDIRALREVGYKAPEIQAEIQRSHGVRLSTNTIYTHIKRMGLGGRILKMGELEARSFRKSLYQSKAPIKEIAARYGVPERYAKQVRSGIIKRGGSRRKPEYSRETKDRCVAIANRCGSADRASRMIRAVAGIGPSGAAIRNWRRGRGL